MWASFARCACDIHVHMRCVCLRAISGGKSEKVWAHVTKLSNTSIRCNICSSVIVNKGGNTSNIIKHLLTKHNMRCAVFTISPGFSCNCNSRGTFTSNFDSAVVTLTRHCTYSQSQKYIICMCFSLKSCRRCSDDLCYPLRLCYLPLKR